MTLSTHHFNFPATVTVVRLVSRSFLHGTLVASLSLGCLADRVQAAGKANDAAAAPAPQPAQPAAPPESLPPRPTKAASQVTSTWKPPIIQVAEPKEVLSPQEALQGERLAGVTIESIEGAGAVVRVDVQGASTDVNRSHLLMLVNQPVKKGDRLTLNYEARSMADAGLINVRVGNTTTAWSATVEQDFPLPVGDTWRPYTVSWSAPADVDAKQTDVRLRFGKQAQNLQVRNIQVMAMDAGQAGWVVQAGREWRPIDLQDPDIVPGSALDFSGLWDGLPAGSHGRVIVNKTGRLAFEKAPDVAVRFWGCSINMGPAGAFSLRHDATTLEGDRTKTPITKQDLEAFANRIRNQGYNLFRPHFLDAALMENAQPGQDFDPVALDNFEYLVYCLKKNGIYVYIDAMTRTGGYSHGGGWGGDGVDRKSTLYFDPAARDLWASAVRKLMTHVNPYTGMSLVEDPVVTTVLFCNEQEIDPWGVQYFPPALLPGIREWLGKKYASDDALKAAWTDAAGKCWLPAGETLATVTADEFWGNSPRSRDINLYIYEAETNMLKWYEKTIREIGYKGITTQFDCGMRYRNVAVRSNLQAVSIHAYGAPTNNWISKGSRQHQNSMISSPEYRDALFFRYLATTRFLDRPLLVTEYNQEFWNAFRHEEGLIMGGYSAFQNMDMLVPHAHPVMLSVDRPMLPYFVGADPIGRASQVVTGLLFARRDVKPAQNPVTLGIDNPLLFEQGRSGSGFAWEMPQDRLSLVTGFGVTYTDGKGIVHGKVAGAKDYSVHNAPSFAAIMKQLADEGKVPAGNRTNLETGQFETLDGQLFMQRQKSQLEISTPRTQGASLLAGSKIKLPQFEIVSTSADAAITVSALDSADLANSSRLLLVIATDALNTDMAFTGQDRTELVSIGNTPALVKTGQFSIALTHPQAASLKVWGLRMNGTRTEVIPTRVEDGRLLLNLDTTKLAEPYLFYEISK